MIFSRNPTFVTRYAFTIVAVTLATLLRFALDPILELRAPFIIYLPTVVLCAWFGGMGPGLLATVLSAITTWYVFLPPQFSFVVTEPTAPAQLIIFTLAGVFNCWLAESLHRARRKTEASEAREREQRERYRVTLSSIGDAVIATDAHGQVTFMNPVAETLTGWQNTEAAGLPLEKVFHIINEETRQPVENPALRAMQESIIVGLANHTLLIARDGAEIPIDDSGAPIKDAEGKVIGAVLIFRDITERRQVEKERALLVELARMLDSGFDAIIVRDAQDHIMRWNRAAAELYGWTSEEALGQVTHTLFKTVFPKPLPEIVTDLRRNRRWQGELIHTCKDGQLVTVLSCWVLECDAQGQPGSVLETNMDITERKRAEEALRASEARERARAKELEALFATMPTPIWRSDDPDCKHIVGNPVANALLGASAGGNVSRSTPASEAVVYRTLRAGVDVPPEQLPMQRAAHERVLVQDEEYELVLSDGRRVHLLMHAAPLYDSAGKVRGALAGGMDITERKRAEEALRGSEARLAGLINSAMDAVIVVDAAQRILLFNPAAEQMFGCSGGEARGGSLDRFIPARFRDAHRQHIGSFGTTGVTSRRMGALGALSGLRTNGEEFPIEASISHMEADGQKLFTVILRDVTERKRSEDERAQLLVSERAAREQAETASRAKDEFVAMISHEIRSPLNAILGWVQILRTGQLDQAATERALETIERNAQTQAQLIEDLLDTSRIITGKLTLNVRPLELRQIVETALDSIRPAAEAKAIQLRWQLATQDGEVSGDPARLQQIVWNLLSNAVKFTPHRGRIEIGLARADSHLRLTVRDSGAGISPEFLPYVFDRFSQANTSSERKYGGLGLGLAIVRHLVELHGGTVHADSPGDGQGATFTVTLPIRDRQKESTEFKAADASGASIAALAEAIRLDGLRILVVDDEAGSRDLLLTMLEQRGADVRACASAAEVLEVIAQWPPAILVSDIGMPEVDGYALLRKLRALPAAQGGEIPAVALTGYSRRADRTRALAAGFQMHVSKPVEAAELIAVIASLAGRMNIGGL
ncbi:MAG: PAS domain S-box protein [Acidobacteria bacterium]|nr:PAS domain S-box protein [Acidobacteriota bacterium]